MKQEKYQCPLCLVSHNLSNEHSNKNFQNNEKLFCSSCISKLLNKENNLIFPNDFFDHSHIKPIDQLKVEQNKKENKNEEIKHQTINNSIIEELKEQSIKKTLIIQEIKHQSKNKPLLNEISQQQNTQNNNAKNEARDNSSTSSKKYYVKKTVKVNKLPEYKSRENTSSTLSLCPTHSLPLNVICIKKKKKICSQCALNKIHINHKIITEKDFIQYIEELSKIYNNLEINHNKYCNYSNNSFSTVDEIVKLFLEKENNLLELKKKIIDNLNNQFEILLKFIYLRKKEIYDKYQQTNYDISSLIESSNDWIKIVSEKLDKSNSKNNYCSIFLDNDENRNIFNLISSGKELNEKYNFVQEINSIIDKLQTYKDKGIAIKQNDDIINALLNNKKLIYVEENPELIKILNLSTYGNLVKKSKPKNFESITKFDKNGLDEIEFGDNRDTTFENINNIDISKYCNKDIDENNQKIYFRKIVSEIGKGNYTENDFYKKKDIKVIKNHNKIYENTYTNANFNRKTISEGKKIKNKINFSEINEENPMINNINKINKKINKLLRNNTAGNMHIKLPKNRNNENNETLEISNDNNININFNGHIFNYNSDSNFSINLPEINKNNTKIKNNNEKINDIIKLITPNKSENKNNRTQALEKQKLMRCFSFDAKAEKNKLFTTNKTSSKSILNKNPVNNLKTNYIVNTCNNHKLYEGKSLRNSDFFLKKSDNISIKSKGSKNNCKTLTVKDLEKYVNYQLKKNKPNFNRINLRDIGMKMICLFFNKKKKKKYKEIKLQGCNLIDLDFGLFSKSLIKNNISIPIVNVSENRLTDDCSFYLLDFINDYNEIQNIILSNNFFSKSIKEKIREVLKIRSTPSKDIIIQI